MKRMRKWGIKARCELRWFSGQNAPATISACPGFASPQDGLRRSGLLCEYCTIRGIKILGLHSRPRLAESKEKGKK